MDTKDNFQITEQIIAQAAEEMPGCSMNIIIFGNGVVVSIEAICELNNIINFLHNTIALNPRNSVTADQHFMILEALADNQHFRYEKSIVILRKLANGYYKAFLNSIDKEQELKLYASALILRNLADSVELYLDYIQTSDPVVYEFEG